MVLWDDISLLFDGFARCGVWGSLPVTLTGGFIPLLPQRIIISYFL